MPRFDLSACSHLRIFELRLGFSPCHFRDLASWLAAIIGTITSPVLSRFILTVDITNYERLFRTTGGENAWEAVDESLLRLSQRTEMKMVVRRTAPYVTFRDVMEGAFPLMVSAGAIEFEFDHFSSSTRRPVSFSFIQETAYG